MILLLALALGDAGALAAMAEKRPIIADALRTLQAEALLAQGRRAEAKSIAAGVQRRDARWAPRAAWTVARASMPGDCGGALAALEAAQPTPPWIPPGAHLALRVEAHLACGQRSEAERLARALATEHPGEPEGRAAAARLTLTPAERLAQAAAYERARDYLSARELLAALVGTEVDEEARMALGKLHLDRLRDAFDVAERAFAEIAAGAGPRAEEAAYLVARSRGRAGDSPGAIAAYAEYLRRHPRGHFAEDARFFSAFTHYEDGRYEQAAAAFEGIRSGGWAGAARWYRAWSLYLAGADEAVALFDALVRREGRAAKGGRKAAYWAARALEGRRPEEARRRRATLLSERPDDWYALLIRARFPEESSPLPVLPAPSAPTTPVPSRFSREAAEIRALRDAGLGDFARRALAALSPALRRADAWKTEIGLAREIGDHLRRVQATAIRFRALFEAPPMKADVQLWRDLWPEAYDAAVRRFAKVYGVEPGLVFAFMRKESNFDPDAVSRAHAVGLMQLLPRTARKIEERMGGRRAADLFDPGANIELGTWYVAALQARFAGQLPLVAAAYNAGPEAVVSWTKGRGRRVDTDEFVERIPYRETRGYVKRMAEFRAMYARLYDGARLADAARLVPPELDLEVAPGVDF